ncbi:MAG: sulfur carrier protein ThiS [Pseudarcicella sp.]|nr:sulfur carrier protein ThiS [Pseudarcicella sp.]MBP6411503.1 sulfur carrier protein ThiS [Pseudarcicella sp.]
MNITINSKFLELPSNATLSQAILLHIGESAKGLAVALNAEVIPKANWDTQILYPNDQILIIKATQGG